MVFGVNIKRTDPVSLDDERNLCRDVLNKVNIGLHITWLLSVEC